MGRISNRRWYFRSRPISPKPQACRSSRCPSNNSSSQNQPTATRSSISPDNTKASRYANNCVRPNSYNAIVIPPSESFLRRSCHDDVAIEHAVENIERHTAAIKPGFVELLDIELRTKIFLCALSIVDPYRMPELVAAGLPRRGAIAFDFAGHESRRVAFLIDEILDRLLARPFEMM